ncbi:MAG: hypothetical protein K9H58_16270 [Bacteroidales bacterium]|nr:hypothetical protein [Bacteroidales bacterium]
MMNRITLTFLGLCLSVLAFSQEKNQDKWETVISEMTKANEGDTITYRSKKILEWSDFKMLPDSNNDSRVNIELTFGVFVKKVNVWTGVITVDSYGGIRRDLSWVNSLDKSQQLLEYLQLKYEIAHYFAKKSEIEINSKKINAGNRNRINGIIETHLNGRDKALNEFDIESDYGNRAEIIEKWKQKLHNNEI